MYEQRPLKRHNMATFMDPVDTTIDQRETCPLKIPDASPRISSQHTFSVYMYSVRALYEGSVTLYDAL